MQIKVAKYNHCNDAIRWKILRSIHQRDIFVLVLTVFEILAFKFVILKTLVNVTEYNYKHENL